MLEWWRRRLRQRQDRDSALADRLIEANRARPLAGMAAPDWHQIRRIGAQRWSDVARAQMKYNNSTAVGGVRGTRYGGRG